MSNTLLHPSSHPNLWACRAWNSCSGQRYLYENSCIPSSLQTQFNPQLLLKLILLLQEKKRLLNHRTNVIQYVTWALVWTMRTKHQGGQKARAKIILPVYAHQAFLWTELSLEASTGVTPWKPNHEETWPCWGTTSESKSWAVQEIQFSIPTTESFLGTKREKEKRARERARQGEREGGGGSLGTSRSVQD